MMETVNWIFSELVRLFSDMPVEKIQKLIANVSVSTADDIWETDGTKRVLRSDLGCREISLYLAYHQRFNGPLLSRDLHKWSEYENSLALYKRLILTPLHEDKLILFNQNTDTITISPLGIRQVEENVINYSSGR